MIQRYDWKCDCGHLQSVKADDGHWCSAKTVMQLEAALLAALKEWEQIHGPWREACGADHWAAIARSVGSMRTSGGYTWADGSPRNEPYYAPNPPARSQSDGEVKG